MTAFYSTKRPHFYSADTYLSDLQCITTVSSSLYPEIPKDDHCYCRHMHEKVGSFSCWFQASISGDIALTFYSCQFFFSHWLLLGVQGCCSELYVNRSVIKGYWLITCFTVVPSITRFAITAITSGKVYAGGPVLAWIFRTLVDVWNRDEFSLDGSKSFCCSTTQIGCLKKERVPSSPVL